MTLSWRVQNIVVIGRVYFTLECFEFSSNFEFDRNMLSGTGAWSFNCITITHPKEHVLRIASRAANYHHKTRRCKSMCLCYGIYLTINAKFKPIKLPMVADLFLYLDQYSLQRSKNWFTPNDRGNIFIRVIHWERRQMNRHLTPSLEVKWA